jgi:DNA (cytosine-5)-methyltransferase 1
MARGLALGVYYNEFNIEACLWIREAIQAGLLPEGDIDDRPLQEVSSDDLKGYTQHHFFAGIGGWALAARRAGIPDDYPLWTGSCPCQPFSSAGRQKGKSDERHLWPVWFRLIRECRPSRVVGEQVASAITHGWLDDVYADLEGEGYAVASAVLPACSVGKAHRRDRLWFGALAHADPGSASNVGDTRSAACGRDTRAVPSAKEKIGSQRIKNGDNPVRPTDAGYVGDPACATRTI